MLFSHFTLFVISVQIYACSHHVGSSYLEISSRLEQPLVGLFPLSVPVDLFGAIDLLLEPQLFAFGLADLMRFDELEQQAPVGHRPVDGGLHNLHREDFALHLVDDLTSELCGNRLVELPHQDVAEIAQVLGAGFRATAWIT
jgi:hypothetical protein